MALEKVFTKEEPVDAAAFAREIGNRKILVYPKGKEEWNPEPLHQNNVIFANFEKPEADVNAKLVELINEYCKSQKIKTNAEELFKSAKSDNGIITLEFDDKYTKLEGLGTKKLGAFESNLPGAKATA